MPTVPSLPVAGTLSDTDLLWLTQGLGLTRDRQLALSTLRSYLLGGIGQTHTAHASGVSVPNAMGAGTPIASVPLEAGTWLVSGNGSLLVATTGVAALFLEASITAPSSLTPPDYNKANISLPSPEGGAYVYSLLVPPQIITTAGETWTLNLGANSSLFSTASGSGQITAVRLTR